MISNKSNSYGFYESTIQGNASFDVVGNWALGSNSKSWFLNDSTVNGDVDITLDTTSLESVIQPVQIWEKVFWYTKDL